ncbi:3-hydroxyacyl-CoA dehydrogenase family protein [Roseivirga pacifica]
MRLLVVGNNREFQEFEEKFGGAHELTHHTNHYSVENVESFDAIFDFLISEEPETFGFYEDFEGLNLFVNAPKITLAELAFFNDTNAINLFGFNGLPTFLNREVLEVSLLKEDTTDLLKSLCDSLGTDFQLVDDRVGMVTPRIIFMIINEAFYTVQEGTASKEDIDQGMKLGTNYPFGPFEWAEKIGIDNIYELLEVLYEDTKEERYKICPALKKSYLKLNQQ